MFLFGLIGFPLGHSFSKKYFTEKFEREGLAATHAYELFELPEITALPQLLETHPNLKGFNITIPHKKNILPYLAEFDPLAERIGAVNVAKVLPDGRLKGFNSDYWGFRWSVEQWEPFQRIQPKKALILGDGGATKAVRIALEDLGISYQTVSRKESAELLSYTQLNESVLADHQLIINSTPLGTYPKVDACPDIPYALLSERHLLYDLVYNPAETLFMKRGAEYGAATHNGYRMLELQAEKSWEIWNE